MKKYFFISLLITLSIIPSSVYALSTPNKIVNHEDIASVSSYIADTEVRNALSNQKWLFTHASVGENMKSGMITLKNSDSRYAFGMISVSNASTSVTTSNGNIYEINRGNPGIQAKLDYFANAFNTYGWANKVSIAMNKYCYVDITALAGSKTVNDMPTYANQYLNSIQALESSYPGVTFVYMTVPIMSSQSNYNALIYAFNQTVRNYASSHGKYLYDIADIESHDPSNVHQTGSNGGNPLEMFYDGYTTDGGHPDTALGTQRIALGWYAMAISIAYNKNQVYTPPATTSVTGITVNPTTMNLVVGESKSIATTIAPANATNKSITWTSSDNSIATVNGGIVKAIKIGKATITANTADGNKKATVAVTVNPTSVTSVIIKNKDITKLEVDQTLKLEITIAPTNATNKEVVWVSSNVNVATVSNTGLVTTLSKGVTTITVTTKDKNRTDKIDIEVIAEPVALESIKIKEIKTPSLDIGDKLQLTSVIEPSDATDAQYIWESSDNNVATVDQDGIVSGIKDGTVTITLKTKDDKFIDKIELKIVGEEDPLVIKKEPSLNLIKIGGVIIILGVIVGLAMKLLIKK